MRDQASSIECLVSPRTSHILHFCKKIEFHQTDSREETVPAPLATPRVRAGVPGYIPYSGKKADPSLPDHRFIAVGFSGQMRENTFHDPGQRRFKN